jgi:hypothetical protein
LLEAAKRRRPDLPSEAFAPVGWEALARLIGDFTAVGVSKFVVRPAVSPEHWPRFVDEFVARMQPLQT